MNTLGYVILGSVIVAIAVYIALANEFCGLPHKCSKHGWQGGSVCIDCETEKDK